MLENLARPSVGHWWEFVRRLVPVLADSGDPAFRNVRDLVLGPTRDDLPAPPGSTWLSSNIRRARRRPGPPSD